MGRRPAVGLARLPCCGVGPGSLPWGGPGSRPRGGAGSLLRGGPVPCRGVGPVPCRGVGPVPAVGWARFPAVGLGRCPAAGSGRFAAVAWGRFPAVGWGRSLSAGRRRPWRGRRPRNRRGGGNPERCARCLGAPAGRRQRGLARDERALEQPAAAADQQHEDGRHHRGPEDARDPLREARAQARRGRRELAVMDDAGHDGGHEEGEGGHREEEVDRAAPDAEHGGERAHDDEEPEQVARLLARDHGDAPRRRRWRRSARAPPSTWTSCPASAAARPTGRPSRPSGRPPGRPRSDAQDLAARAWPAVEVIGPGRAGRSRSHPGTRAPGRHAARAGPRAAVPRADARPGVNLGTGPRPSPAPRPCPSPGPASAASRVRYRAVPAVADRRRLVASHQPRVALAELGRRAWDRAVAPTPMVWSLLERVMHESLSSP